jgi:uncharacterized protein (DUF58 family)
MDCSPVANAALSLRLIHGALITPELLRRLEQIPIARGPAGEFGKGEQRSKARGQSVEFADHRTYTPGDDFRYLDWNLFGRLDRLFLKLYEEERGCRLPSFWTRASR